MTPEQLDALPPLLLSNAAGVRVTITPVGAAIQRFVVPVSGKELDIVLGWNRPSTYAVRARARVGGAVVLHADSIAPHCCRCCRGTSCCAVLSRQAATSNSSSSSRTAADPDNMRADVDRGRRHALSLTARTAR